jgi:hypothetical protein
MRKKNLFLYLLFFLIISFPYLLAGLSGNEKNIFGGFLINPLDGYSYLSKMRQGYAGNWIFHLPYSIEQGNGAYLFLFYLAAGQLSRIMGLSLSFVFHLLRILSAAWLVFELERLLEKLLPQKNTWVMTLLLFGSGMGWIAALAGAFTSDFWVAEAYIYLSAFSSPHFTLGLALILRIFFFSLEVSANRKKVLSNILISGFLLSIFQPFGFVIASAVFGGYCGWEWLSRRQFDWKKLLALGFGGGPYLIYQWFMIKTDPVLSLWDAQNLTPAPPVWDFVLSLSPCLIIAFYWIIRSRHDAKSPGLKLMLTWLVLGCIMVFFPFPLQRRFMTGLFIPAAILCGYWIEQTPTFKVKKILKNGVLVLSLITNIIGLAAITGGILGKTPAYYLSKGEIEAFTWLEQNTTKEAVVLTGPDTGIYIPAFSGRRVVYGHPFETIHAAEREYVAGQFLTGLARKDLERIINQYQVNYLLWGPREQKKFTGVSIPDEYLNWPVVYQNADVTIFSTR